MSVFGSIFGKNRLGKGSPRPPISRGATLGKIWQKARAHETSGRSCISPAALKSFGYAAWPETKHNIGGAPTRALSPQGCQTGRSMIEMLAVLAIIGILSVVAVAGLMWAFAKYKANNTIHDVHLWELAALDSQQLYEMTSGELVLNELGEVSTHGYPMAIMVQDENVFYISVDDVPQRVCSLTLDMVEKPMIVTVNGTSYAGSDICDADTNQMLFYFNKYMEDVDNTCIPACPSGETCCGGVCREIETPCGSDGCLDCGSKYCTNSNTCCDNPNATKCGSNDCCEGNCCNGTCCPSGQVCGSDGNCACQNNMVLNPDTGLCECSADTPFLFENAGICCQEAYVPVADNDGVYTCQRLFCENTSTGRCFINQSLCGTNCTDTGRTCSAGICYADQCPAGYTFQKIPNGQHDNVGNTYGCQLGQTNCYMMYQNVDELRCFNGIGDTFCSLSESVSNPSPKIGLCNSSDCTSLSAQYKPDITGYYYGGCIWDTDVNGQNDVYCYPKTYTNGTPSTWYCYAKNGVPCSTDCTNPPLCGGACSAGIKCGIGMSPSIQADGTEKCCADENPSICCTKTTCTWGDNERCCSLWSDSFSYLQCNIGRCVDTNCTPGMSFGYLSSVDMYGCFEHPDGTGMSYYVDDAYAPTCYLYNGVLCGQACQENGLNCRIIYQVECGKNTDGNTYCPQTGYAIQYDSENNPNCICSGTITELNGISYCCPNNHQYINGGCNAL